MRALILTYFITVFLSVAVAKDNQLSNSFKKDQTIDRYLFVTSKLSDQDLIELAAQANIAKMTLVLSGFIDPSSAGLEHTKLKIAKINQACCGENGPTWLIYPQLFDKFDVKQVPSFVISKKNIKSKGDFAKVTGIMSVQNALKFIYAGALDPQIKAASKAAYQRFPI